MAPVKKGPTAAAASAKKKNKSRGGPGRNNNNAGGSSSRVPNNPAGFQILADRMEACVGEMLFGAGISSVPESHVLDALNYGNVASRGYRDAARICLRERKTLRKTGGGGRFELTGAGVARCRAAGMIAPTEEDDDDADDDDDGSAPCNKGEKTEEEVQAKVRRLTEAHLERLKASIVKLSNRKAPAKAVDDIFALLCDGSSHGQDEMLRASGYKRTDSSGFKAVWKVFRELALLRQEDGGLYSLDAEKAFPFGLPR